MRRTLFSLLFGLLAAPAFAQGETYDQAASAQQVADLTAIIAGENASRCKALNLAASCTQAQACTAAGAAGGASCTAAQARAAGARIWPDSLSGRDEYVTFEIVLPEFIRRRASLFSNAVTAKCQWWDAQNQTTRDAELTAIGFPTGLTACPYK